MSLLEIILSVLLLAGIASLSSVAVLNSEKVQSTHFKRAKALQELRNDLETRLVLDSAL
jgi:hypothetical protein